MTRSRYRSRPHRIALVLAVLMPLIPTSARSVPDGFGQTAAEYDGDGESVSARNVSLPPIVLPIGLPPPDLDADFPLFLHCSGQATRGGDPRNKVKLTFEGEVVDLEGETVDTFTLTGKTKKKNDGRTDHIDLEMDEEFFARFSSAASGEGDLLGAFFLRPSAPSGKEVDTLGANCGIGRPGECVGDATTGCLRNGRFKAQVGWKDPFDGAARQATPKMVDGETLLFGFFPLNDEILVKVLDSCTEPFGHFWVFYAATTNVEYTLTVTDTMTGLSNEYGQRLRGVPADAITDTQAFATCP